MDFSYLLIIRDLNPVDYKIWSSGYGDMESSMRVSVTDAQRWRTQAAFGARLARHRPDHHWQGRLKTRDWKTPDQNCRGGKLGKRRVWTATCYCIRCCSNTAYLAHVVDKWCRLSAKKVMLLSSVKLIQRDARSLWTLFMCCTFRTSLICHCYY